MRIALVVPEFPPHTIGGGGVVFERLADGLSSRHDVQVFSACDPVRSWTAARAVDSAWSERYLVRRYPLVPIFGPKTAFRSVLPLNPVAAGALFLDLGKWRPDVAHLHGIGYAVVDLAARYLRIRKVPYVLSDHGVPTSVRSARAPVRAAYWLYTSSILRGTVRGARQVTAVSSAEGEELQRLCGVRPAIVPNGASVMPRDDGEVVRRLGLLRSSERRYKLVVAAGRLTESKGFDVLIEAMRELGEEIQCVIAGQGCQGAHEKALRAKAPANVAFVGELSRSELGSLLSLADVLAVPSRHEPFGLVALEAIASGTRVVASAVGGLPEFLCPPLARLVAPDDPEALAVAIADSTALGPFDSEERRLASELMARHSWGVICSRYEALLSEVVDDP